MKEKSQKLKDGDKGGIYVPLKGADERFRSPRYFGLIG